VLPHWVVINAGDVCTEDVVDTEREEKSECCMSRGFSGKGYSNGFESVAKGVPTI